MASAARGGGRVSTSPPSAPPSPVPCILRAPRPEMHFAAATSAGGAGDGRFTDGHVPHLGPPVALHAQVLCYCAQSTTEREVALRSHLSCSHLDRNGRPLPVSSGCFWKSGNKSGMGFYKCARPATLRGEGDDVWPEGCGGTMPTARAQAVVPIHACLE